METEVYDCGCQVGHRQVDHAEFPEDPPALIVVSNFVPCAKHKDSKVVPTPDARLVTVVGEHEKFLNE